MRINFKDATLIEVESDIEFLPEYFLDGNIGQYISKLVFTFEESADEYNIENVFRIYFEIKSNFIKASASDIVDDTSDTDYSDITIEEFFNMLKRHYSNIDKFCSIHKTNDY